MHHCLSIVLNFRIHQRIHSSLFLTSGSPSANVIVGSRFMAFSIPRPTNGNPCSLVVPFLRFDAAAHAHAALLRLKGFMPDLSAGSAVDLITRAAGGGYLLRMVAGEDGGLHSLFEAEGAALPAEESAFGDHSMGWRSNLAVISAQRLVTQS